MLVYQVYVTSGPPGKPIYEHLIEVEAKSWVDAMVTAIQMANCRKDTVPEDHFMALSAHVITDSELTDEL